MFHVPIDEIMKKVYTSLLDQIIKLNLLDQSDPAGFIQSIVDCVNKATAAIKKKEQQLKVY